MYVIYKDVQNVQSKHTYCVFGRANEFLHGFETNFISITSRLLGCVYKNSNLQKYSQSQKRSSFVPTTVTRLLI